MSYNIPVAPGKKSSDEEEREKKMNEIGKVWKYCGLNCLVLKDGKSFDIYVWGVLGELHGEARGYEGNMSPHWIAEGMARMTKEETSAFVVTMMETVKP